MDNLIIIDNVIYKQYKDTKYYCSKDGKIYSDFSQKKLKPLRRGSGEKKYLYIDINFGEGQKHCPIHRIVFETWVRPLRPGEVVRHLDDNSLNNNLDNLSAGGQKDNIQDCISNEHRVGNTWILTVYDKEIQKTITFCPAKDFIKYSNHSCKSGNISRMMRTNWFKKRYNVISFFQCENLIIKEGVETIPDECKEVD